MGKRNRQREAHRRRDESIVSAVLKAHAQVSAPVRAVARFEDFKSEYSDKIKVLRGYALRSPRD